MSEGAGERSMSGDVHPKTAIVHRLRHAAVEYAIICAYLYVCFGAILLLKVSVLKDAGLGAMPWGFAVIKALIVGKFMLLGHDIRLGERFTSRPLIYPTLYRSAVFIVFLFVLLALEEVAVGALHGQTIARSVAAVAGGKFFEILATTLIMFLALVPYFAIRQLADVLGARRLFRLFFVDGSWS